MRTAAQAGKAVGLGRVARSPLRSARWSIAIVASVALLTASAASADTTIITTGTLTSNTAVKLCPSGTVLSGLNVDVEDRGFVDMIVLLCRSGSGKVTSGQMIGIPGTIPQGFARSSCAPPMVAVGLYGRSGDILDAVGVRCASPGSPPVNAALQGGVGGGPRGPVDCPAGMELIGLQGKTNGDYYGAPDVSSVTGVCGPAGAGGTASSRPRHAKPRHRQRP
jgi:hypothetical protein